MAFKCIGGARLSAAMQLGRSISKDNMRETHYLFFADSIEDDRLFLNPTETRHAVSALRARTGDTLLATDGKGNIYTCIFECERDGMLCANIVKTEHLESPRLQIHVFAGLPDRDPFERMIVDLTALGVTKIVPVVAEFCQNPWWDKWEKLSERFQTKMISALKQSRNPFLPVLSKPLDFNKAFEQLPQFCVTADPQGLPITSLLEKNPNLPVGCLIGPPGGFSDTETARCKGAGCRFIKISPTRLRTELASVAVVSQLLGIYSG